jgi:hypothetical protein
MLPVLQAHEQSAGLTLTCCSQLLVVGTLPREDLLRQLLGRLHRFGQAREQRVTFLVGRGSVHEAMYDRWAARIASWTVKQLQPEVAFSDSQCRLLQAESVCTRGRPADWPAWVCCLPHSCCVAVVLHIYHRCTRSAYSLVHDACSNAADGSSDPAF